jgi:phosphopantothenoylcysteine decarboxylase / phosphopantothenate---cysteine ligase
MPGASEKTVLLGVTGGIAAYKAAELARLLVRSGVNVKVLMTESGQKFVTPLTFRTITGNPVTTSMWADPTSPFPHISLSEEADVIVVAPATANIIAKMARGIADDLLSTTLLAARGTIVVAPAMNTRMYLNQATMDNLRRLRGMGVVVVECGEGPLACGDEGVGRMAEPQEIMLVIEAELARTIELEGRKVVVTAGPTREYIDPVRFISNPSTGKMGYTLADRAAKRGAEVVLISGPVGLYPPAGVQLISVASTEEMAQAVKKNLPGADVLFMAAAVADYKPAKVAERKMKKSEGVPKIELEPTEDIIKAVSKARDKCLMVGFAAETDNVIENAKGKLKDKGLDLIVANEVGSDDSGFGTDTDLAAVISNDSEEIELRMMSKAELSDAVLDKVAGLLR